MVAHHKSNTTSVPIAAGGVRRGRFCGAAEKIGLEPERVAPRFMLTASGRTKRP
jgi:hypothetical protein